jgi:hypothetical protein
VDPKAFFDEIPHGLMLQLIRRKVADEQFVTLLARLLKGERRRATGGAPTGTGRDHS